MRELLQRWAIAEPERCKNVGNFPQVFIDNAWATVWLNETGAVNAIVQAAIQETIEFKGWQYEQRWDGVNKVALITYPPITIRHTAHSHAEALLLAYLEALEAIEQFSQRVIA